MSEGVSGSRLNNVPYPFRFGDVGALQVSKKGDVHAKNAVSVGQPFVLLFSILGYDDPILREFGQRTSRRRHAFGHGEGRLGRGGAEREGVS
jgi:hypothetical protein